MRSQAEPSWRWPDRKMSQVIFRFTQSYPLKQFDELMGPREQVRTVHFELRLNLILLLGTASQCTSMLSV